MTLHYHGTPITPKADLLKMAGANFCVSHFRPEQVKICHQVGQTVMLDNGAFSAWKSGKPIEDWRPYYNWCDQWLDYPTTWAVIPDVITGDEHDNSMLCRAWPFRDRGAGVWHMHESFGRLISLLHTFPRVCIGSSAQYAELLTPAWERRMDDAWREIDKRFTRTPYVHMLRGMQLVRQRWPFASVDSTDIGRNFKAKLRPDDHGLDVGPRAPVDKASEMRAKWDVAQCPPRFVCRGQQLDLEAA
jgi:hypothetical protein